MAKKQSAKTETKKSGAKSQDRSQKKGAQKQARSSGGPLKFAKDVRRELGKVNWPDRAQLQQSTAIVVILVIVLMAYVYAWDFVFRSLARLIFA